VPGYKIHDDQIRYLFNTYYNTIGPMHSRPHRGLLSRPTVDQVLAYRARIDERMNTLLQRQDLPVAIQEAVTIGLHHEQQHQELFLTDIKHLFSCNPLLPAYVREKPASARAAVALAFHDFAGGLSEIGHSGEGFSFDNELPRHRTYTDAFRLANRAVTNGEYLEFVREGGYEDPIHWLSDGWATVQKEGWKRPFYWTPSLEEEFTLTGLRELSPTTPICHLSYYEADAFARWAGARLPSETEWELAASDLTIRGNFVEKRRWHPETPVLDGQLLQMFGDVWEWTRSAYSPYPGFKTANGALGEYNGKFMVNQLVLRGGSCATPASHIRATYRNFFNPGARWQFTGLRLARSQSD
jgi:ergothioneine biosynthesis protein EgtB